MWEAIAPLTPPGQRNNFVVWNRLRGDWVPTNATQTTYILRGEGLVYKRVGVTDTPNLAFFVRLTTDATYATEHDLEEAAAPSIDHEDSNTLSHPAPCTPASGSTPSTLQPDFVAGSSRVIHGTKRTVSYVCSSNKKRRLGTHRAVLETVSKGKGRASDLADVIEISSDEEEDARDGRDVIEISSDEEEDAHHPEVIYISDDEDNTIMTDL